MDEEKKIEEPSFGTRVKTAISKKSNTKTVPINFPRKTYRRFAAWSRENSNDCYWLAIDRLLDIYEQKFDASADLDSLFQTDQMLVEEITSLKEEVNELKTKVDGGVHKEVKHFGKKE